MSPARQRQSLPRRVLGPFVNRPRLLAAIFAGAVVWAACLLALDELSVVTSAILAWDATCLTFIATEIAMMWGAEPSTIQSTAARQDEGQGLILGLVILAAAASIVVIAAELSIAKADHGLIRAMRIALVFATVAASWFMVQLIFALHYAHGYYAPDIRTVEDDVIGGLLFPGVEAPDYWDFLHFSVIIGVACQTADIAFTSKALRRIGTVHGVVAFTFNTVVLALTINLLAGVF